MKYREGGLRGRVISAMCGLILCLFLAAASAAEPGGGNAKKLKFIFITTCLEEDFFKPVQKGMEDDSPRKMGVECVFTGTTGVDVKAQAEMVRQGAAGRLRRDRAEYHRPRGF